MRKTKKGIPALRKKLDKLFSEYVRSTGVCARCGRGDITLQCAHIVPRTNLTLRWDPMNALAMCIKDHMFWAHRNPLEFVVWIKSKYPARYKYLLHNKNTLIKRTEEDYQTLIDYYKKKLEDIETF